MQSIINWSFFYNILLMLLGGIWKNCSVLGLLQIWHKLLINDSDKFIQKPSIL